MTKLNPQLARELVVLVESPRLIPAVFALRADCNSIVKASILAGIKGLKNSPAGQQALSIFQCDDIDVPSNAFLESALSLILTHKRLLNGERHP